MGMENGNEYIERIRRIVKDAAAKLVAQIRGGRVQCESEATLQLHLGRIIANIADLESVHADEAFSIELEKPVEGERRGRLDVWFRLIDAGREEWRCAVELKFFKKKNQREPNNRYDVFKDIARLEKGGDVADIAFMLVATDHKHYVNQKKYKPTAVDFDFRHKKSYQAGSELVYNGDYGDGHITLAEDYRFEWTDVDTALPYLLVEITPSRK